jgi:sulfatase modifying factor 1
MYGYLTAVRMGFVVVIFMLAASISQAGAATTLDRTEVTIAAFAEFVAATGTVTKAESEGGMVYEAGWTIKPAWNWRRPYGIEGAPDEPAVHITFDEAEAYCRWRGKRLPSRDEWINAGYREARRTPPAGFVTGKTYPYPTGERPNGANCLGDCAIERNPPARKRDYGKFLWRGNGHAPAGSTVEGVNGLFDMGANVWEWARIGAGQQQATMGGSWWYGAAQMQAHYGATKPRDMAVVYVGFRCAASTQ